MKVKVIMDKNLFLKMKLLTDYEYEIGGWLIGKVIDKQIHLTDILVPPQDVSFGSVDMDAKSISWILKKHPEKVKNLIGHWHSHNSMSAFFSAVDKENHKKIMDGKKYFLFIVTAQDKENNTIKSQIKVCFNVPFNTEIDGEIEVQSEENEAIKKEVEQIIKENVSRKTYSGYSEYRDYNPSDWGQDFNTRNYYGDDYPYKQEKLELEPNIDELEQRLSEIEYTIFERILKEYKEFDELEVQVIPKDGDWLIKAQGDGKLIKKLKEYMKKWI